MCGGRVFNVKAAKESCEDKDYKLTYSKLKKKGKSTERPVRDI